MSVPRPTVLAMTRRDALHASGSSQLTFDEVGTLRDTTFVVVDLETTGGSAENDAITEIGAVKVRGGEVLGELATLVDPQRSLPPQIVRLTGITSAMLVDAPPIAQVLPAFLEFARGAVLVAHNAGFDIGFLKAAARQCGIDWPQPAVLCTVRLARRVLSRDEAPRVSLGALAQLLGASTTPNHRALDDARATVDVLHALIARVGNQGVGTVDELRRYRTQVPSALRGKRHLADGMPYAPGVYLFRGPSGEVLYVGTAVNLRRRVQQYFTGADPRGRMREMVTIATAVDHVICAHPLEAAVRELRLLGAHAPPYNRKSRFPHRWWWVVLTEEPFPRFSVVRTTNGRPTLGPFRVRGDATTAALALARFTGVRTCTNRIGAGGKHGPACDGQSYPHDTASPCPAAAGVDATAYRDGLAPALAVLDGTHGQPLQAMCDRVAELGALRRYETAARQRDATTALIEVLARQHRLHALARIEELIAARPDGDGGWQIAVVRHGQLAGAAVARRGVPPMPVVAAASASAQVVLPTPEPFSGAAPEETGLITRWLAEPGVRIVSSTDGYAEATGCAASLRNWAAAARSARMATALHQDDRGMAELTRVAPPARPRVAG
ncbi:Probable DNA polymerase III epsilon subunit [Mycobacteroides abscessus subsp. massiliense]|nr:Probable DNA polymerase III epsilon subunit [Mycobacteroides abscessus]SKD32733.1 Probable DNA polymerase III epsilon subunit [Mycobacteroides abscessus subsp. massiliense]CPZ55497.1 Probable DNA polymerase III epsilon subunit [Mycobacteroides abscessus]SKD85671.1 Probable DNA polymerase III epsilon subunit [Mycobacteroides abscessus subsp. massiliense]SKE07744.1 Probable DNA polymerase III epsilon subunit [Mycobacteroides abscessus subsp. massiliense]